jgi:hypothetical protein
MPTFVPARTVVLTVKHCFLFKLLAVPLIAFVTIQKAPAPEKLEDKSKRLGVCGNRVYGPSVSNPLQQFTTNSQHPAKLHRVSSSLANAFASARRFQIHRFHVRDSPTVVQPFMQGRQLNVKEFRYLRTVRVTAAVCLHLWAGVRWYTSSTETIFQRPQFTVLALSCVFGKQSLSAIF